jgi:predicted MFS family arabinose efflux permease
MPLALYWLALGAFCIGTATFITAPLIPAIAAELGVTLPTAGHLVTLYALTYAVGSPVLSTLLGGLNRKTLLVAALTAFTAINLLAAATQSFWQLMTIQALVAIAAGLFMPAANGVAAMIVAPALRGRAIAVVIGGLSTALALGVPIGAMIGRLAHWRTAFVLIALAGATSVAGLIAGLPRDLPRGSATLAERIAVGRRPEVLLALAVTLLWAMGVFAFYTFVAPFLTGAIGFQPSSVPLILFVFGLAGWLGNITGGRMNDGLGAARTLAIALAVLGANYLAFGVAGLNGPSAVAMVAAAASFVIGGVAGWAFHPAQSARLVQYAPDAAVVALSLNQSALYFGTAAGAALGALIVSAGPVTNLAWAAAACQFAALAVLGLSLRRARAAAALQAAE